MYSPSAMVYISLGIIDVTCTFIDALNCRFAEYIDDQMVKCLIVGSFFLETQAVDVQVSLKEYDLSNATISYQTNVLDLYYLPMISIWPLTTIADYIYYLNDPGALVSFNTNIMLITNDTY